MRVEQMEKCISRYGDDIYRFCCYLTGNRQLADDLYQDCFLTALESQTEIDSEKEKQFLTGIAANLWKNQWRKEKRRQKIVTPVAFDGSYMSEQSLFEETSQVQDALDTYIHNETEKMVSKLVNELPEKYRVVVLMYYSADLSTQEIADSLHISKGTVTSRLKRAREKVMRGLEEIGYER